MSRVESQIGKVDKRIATLHTQMAKAAADYGRLADLQRELDAATAEKDDLELAWLEAADLVGADGTPRLTRRLRTPRRDGPAGRRSATSSCCRRAVYLDGNSLGARPRAAAARAAEVVEREWGQDLIGSWNTAGWFDLPVRLGDRLAPLIGGGPGTTVVTDTTSANLFKALAAAIDLQAAADPRRTVVVSERDNFPTDLYVARGPDRAARARPRGPADRQPRRPRAPRSTTGPAVVTLSHVNYRTGALWDLAEVTAQVHAAGALVVWDLAHSVGALPIDLTGADADFAVGCTYKYLNGGPGLPRVPVGPPASRRRPAASR